MNWSLDELSPQWIVHDELSPRKVNSATKRPCEELKSRQIEPSTNWSRDELTNIFHDELLPQWIVRDGCTFTTPLSSSWTQISWKQISRNKYKFGVKAKKEIFIIHLNLSKIWQINRNINFILKEISTKFLFFFRNHLTKISFFSDYLTKVVAFFTIVS